MRFFKCNSTEVEAWIHYCNHESKKQSVQWVEKDKCDLDEAKIVPSTETAIAIVFQDEHGVVVIDYLKKKQSTALLLSIIGPIGAQKKNITWVDQKVKR